MPLSVIPTRQRVGAYALCLADSQVLLCRMSTRTRTPGVWTLPGGGIELGEQPHDAVLRELREETGLCGVVGSVVAVHSNVYQSNNGGVHSIRLIYRARVSGTLVAENDGGTDAACWHSLTDLPARLTDWATLALTVVRS